MTKQYTISPQKHFRIWFSAHEDVFLNIQNQLRLIRFRNMNPRAELTLLYSSKMLNQEAISDLNIFCSKFKIKPLDFDTELLVQCTDPIDQKLHHFASHELDTHKKKQGGNLAAASDIARLITPLLRTSGTYSDFDTNINVDAFGEYMDVRGPILLNLGSVLCRAPWTSSWAQATNHLYINNDIITLAIQDNDIHPDSLIILRQLQKKIVKNYEQGMINTVLQYSSGVEILSTYRELYDLGHFSLLEKRSITEFRCALEQSQLSIFATLRLLDENTLRDYLNIFPSDRYEVIYEIIMEALKNIHEYSDFPDSISQEEQRAIETQWMRSTKEEIKARFAGFNEVTVPSELKAVFYFYYKIKDIDDPKRMFKLYQSHTSCPTRQLLIGSVSLISGPGVYSSIISRNGLYEDQLHKWQSFDGHNLTAYFHSKQSIRLHTLYEDLVLSLQNARIGDLCDLSWMPNGAALINRREQCLLSVLRRRQLFFREAKQLKEDKQLALNQSSSDPYVQP